MHFLIDADLPRSIGDLLRSYGHEATDVRDIGMRSALDTAIAQHAQREGWCLLTGDFDFSDIRVYPPSEYAGIVVLVIPPTVTSLYITQLLESFLRQTHFVEQLPGKLAIVEAGRVRLRSSDSPSDGSSEHG
jgi:predicted nuclease of predicted toxin-antitoxin system